MSRKKVKWTLYSYDVWGNELEGFEVNDVFYCTSLELPEEPTNLGLIRALKEYNFLSKKCKQKDLFISDSPTCICFYDDETMEPLGELRRD